MTRFLLRHLDNTTDPQGSSPTAWCATMYEAKARAEAAWGPDVNGVCQSIIDGATNQEWSRVCGDDPAWHFVGVSNGVEVHRGTRQSPGPPL